MAAPRRDEPKRDKLACGTGAVMTMDAPRDGREISANPQEILPSMEYVYSDRKRLMSISFLTKCCWRATNLPSKCHH
jgi:hypothetical protein